MDNFDEYQKFLRYKFGNHSFNIVLFLSLVNFSQHLYFGFQWAETQILEMMLLIFVAILYSVIRLVYSGAYFTRNQNGLLYAIIFTMIGIWNLYLAFSPSSPIIENGKVTNNCIMLISGILWLSLSTSYFARTIVQKRKEERE